MRQHLKPLDRRWILPLAGCPPYQRCFHSCAGLSCRSVLSLHPHAPLPLPNLHTAQDGYAVLSTDGPGEYNVAFEVRVPAAALPMHGCLGLARSQPAACQPLLCSFFPPVSRGRPPLPPGVCGRGAAAAAAGDGRVHWHRRAAARGRRRG